MSNSFLMLVSYQLLGQKQDTASISMFEFDEDNLAINPDNFIIITQKIDLLGQKTSNFLPRTEDYSADDIYIRQLSVVEENEAENSCSV